MILAIISYNLYEARFCQLYTQWIVETGRWYKVPGDMLLQHYM